jgi:hypothetical protein
MSAAIMKMILLKSIWGYTYEGHLGLSREPFVADPSLWNSDSTLHSIPEIYGPWYTSVVYLEGNSNMILVTSSDVWLFGCLEFP